MWAENTSTPPITTSSSWVAKSVTARRMFSVAASVTPMTLIPHSAITTPIPKMMSPGACLSAGKNSPPR